MNIAIIVKIGKIKRNCHKAIIEIAKAVIVNNM